MSVDIKQLLQQIKALETRVSKLEEQQIVQKSKKVLPGNILYGKKNNVPNN